MVIFNSYVKLPEGTSISFGKSIGSPGLSLRKPNCHGLRDVGHAIRLWMGLEVKGWLWAPYNRYYIVIIYDNHPSNHIYIYNHMINHIFVYYIYNHIWSYAWIYSYRVSGASFKKHRFCRPRPGGMLHKIRENQKRLEPHGPGYLPFIDGLPGFTY